MRAFFCFQTVQYEVPQVQSPASTGWTKGSLADYMGYPTGIAGYKASVLPFRAYALIWNEWFRDQNLKNPCYISMGDADTTGKDILDGSYDYVTMTEAGAAPCKVAKYHDYYTSCLPNSQKGPSVGINIGSMAPVVFTEPDHTLLDLTSYPWYSALEGKKVGIANNGSSVTIPYYEETGGYIPAGSQTDTSFALAVDLSTAVGATVNQLRQAFQLQKFYERQAMGGTRYIELIKSHFSVTNPDFRMQRPEYLGGMQTPININQVVQTDATSQQLGGEYVEGVWTWNMSDLSPQGNTAAYSLTTGRNKDLFTHSFTEHGILMGLCCVRTVHTYQQGLNRMFSAKKFTDFYFPEFANLGNMAVYEKEIYLQGTSADDDVFGYQEAWANYRYMPDIVTGEMRSNYSASLDIWHWADYYTSKPSLGSDWIDETKNNIARTLAVQSHDQFMGDFYFQAIYTRPMPLYSVPGLIDHH